jgi:hypothetical protein
MLRQLPPPDASKKEIIQYQLNSDEILKSISSSTPQLDKIKKQPYNLSNLNEVSNLAKEISDSIAEAKSEIANESAAQIIPQSALDADANQANLKRQLSTGDTSDDSFILSLIFKIVPIGMNIVKRGKTIAQGFKEVGMGIVNTVKNTAILTAVTGIDTIKYFAQLFIYAFKVLICTVTIIGNFPKCVIFYFVDVLMFIVLAIILSFLFIIDVFLQIKAMVGTSSIEYFIQLIEMLELLDSFIYSKFSIHIIHYPDSIINMCYRCSAMGDTSAYKAAASRAFNDWFVRIPNEIGGPIGEFFTGIGHIFSFFDLD